MESEEWRLERDEIDSLDDSWILKTDAQLNAYDGLQAAQGPDIPCWMYVMRLGVC